MKKLDATTVTKTPRPVTILQFGGGNFLRAFVDQMIQKANDAGVMNAGVAVVGATDFHETALDLLVGQDGLYHVLLEGIKDGEPVREYTRVDAIQTVVRAHREFDAYRELYLSAELKVIVSNTTEAGIVWVGGDDLSAKPPASFPAKITALLHDRFTHFDGDSAYGLHIVCCELIEDNATTLRDYVLRHASAAGFGPAFEEWLTTACTWHDTLVDRIVPGYPGKEIESVQAELGFADAVVVKGEYFGVWAIGGDPVIRAVLPLDKAGMPVLFMEDIRPFRAKKVKILNGLHTAMAPVGLQLGCESVSEAVAHEGVAAYLRLLLDQEILPSIPEERVELDAFAATIVERFGNPFLHHRLADICLNSLSKWHARNLPVLLTAWDAGRPALGTSFALAALLVLYSGRADVEDFAPNDDKAALKLVREAFESEDLQGGLLRVITELGFLDDDDPRARRLAETVAAQARSLLDRGVEASLRALTGD